MATIYKRMKTTGEVKELERPKMLYVDYNDANQNNGAPNASPYQNLIPLNYVLTSHSAIRGSSVLQCMNMHDIYTIGDETKQNIALKFPIGSLFNDIMCRSLYDCRIPGTRALGRLGNHIATRINEYLYMDYDVNLWVIAQYGENLYRSGMVESGIENNVFGRFSGRDYSAHLAPYSLYECSGMSQTPYIQAVVLPENYLHMKYNLLVNNKLDLSKVIVLVDERIVKTDFSIPALRAWYLKRMRQLKETCCDVWKVPEGFIMENCFKKASILNSVNIFERKKETEGLIQKFYASILERGVMDGLVRQEEVTPSSIGVEQPVIPRGFRIGDSVAQGTALVESGDVGTMTTFNLEEWTWTTARPVGE